MNILTENNFKNLDLKMDQHGHPEFLKDIENYSIRIVMNNGTIMWLKNNQYNGSKTKCIDRVDELKKWYKILTGNELKEKTNG